MTEHETTPPAPPSHDAVLPHTEAHPDHFEPHAASTETLPMEHSAGEPSVGGEALVEGETVAEAYLSHPSVTEAAPLEPPLLEPIEPPHVAIEEPMAPPIDPPAPAHLFWLPAT